MSPSRVLAIQLYMMAGMIFIMILLGGLTRLTDSGLSIVEWQPLTGIFPPFSLQGWQAVFDLYQQSPQYQKINFGMTLEEFKQIFWLEYTHRLWGRAIGLFFLCPLGYALKHVETRVYVPKLLGVWILVGFQGVVGWYMVKVASFMILTLVLIVWHYICSWRWLLLDGLSGLP